MVWVNKALLKGPAGRDGFNATNAAEDDAAIAAFASTPGTVTKTALDSNFERKFGSRGVIRTIYVRANGDDTNDGKTAESALREVRTAVALLDAEGPVIRGSVVIDVGAGTYMGGIRMPATRGAAYDDFVKIIGPDQGVHTNAPMAIIDHAADPTAVYGIQATDGGSLWLQSLQFRGGFTIAVDMRRYVYLHWRKTHINGLGVGRTGLALMDHCEYNVAIGGGIIQNVTQIGVSEHFHVHRSFDAISSNADQMIIRNCETGFQAKENCTGHLDWLNVEDCQTGVELNGMAVANVKAMSLKRNGVGLAVVNSEIHNTGGIQYGAGADANTRNKVVLGTAGAELDVMGWAGGDFARTGNVGQRPLMKIAANYNTVALNATTTETNFSNWNDLTRPFTYATAGSHWRVKIRGRVNTTVTAGYRLLLRQGPSFLTDLTIPAGTAAGTIFWAEFEVTCVADGNNQRAHAAFLSGITGTNFSPTRNAGVGSFGVSVSGVAGNSVGAVELHFVEVWG